jgi:hypothetical protein
MKGFSIAWFGMAVVFFVLGRFTLVFGRKMSCVIIEFNILYIYKLVNP